MNTKNFRTKTEYIERNNGHIDGIWEIALDIGYSAVKLFSPNAVASFPFYARRISSELQYASQTPESSIMFRDLDTDEMWIVGEVAQNTMTTGDTSDSESSLYGRDRFDHPMFKVIAKTGLGIAMLENKFGKPGNDKIVVQTGLPERYMSDEADLSESLSGSHNFALKIGAKDWITFRFRISRDDIYVMSQPKGTLFSVCIDRNGKFHKDAAKYLSSSVLVFDPGFGTLDLFPILSGVVGKGETYSDLGMKRILQETSKLIEKNYDESIPVPAMQKYLEKGVVRHVINKKNFDSKEYPFDKLLSAANTKVCNEAIERMCGAINLVDYNYLIITGGTGAAWLYNIRDRFKNFSTLTILNGNQNDDLSFIYSNVRGYYLYRFNKLGKL